MKLILVDDNTDFREALKNYIELELNHSVIAETTNGKEFLELDVIKMADIILMDIRLADMSGIEVTKKALERHYPLRIVALTNDVQSSTLQLLIETGFKGFINKSDVYSSLEPTLQQVSAGKYVFPKNLML
jgi:NarL family two-component system response regulator LiaR